MLEEFDEFVMFCLEHGGTLKNHKIFGQMVNQLRSKMKRSVTISDDDIYRLLDILSRGTTGINVEEQKANRIKNWFTEIYQKQ